MQLIYSNTTIELPGSWNECNKKQFLQLSKLLHQEKTPDVAALEALRIAWSKTKWSFYGYMRLFWHSKFFDDLKARAIANLSWVFEDQPATEQLLPKYKGFYGPASDFKNMRMIEFHAAEMEHFVYRNDQSEWHLNKLVAMLYRPKKKKYNKRMDDDIRIPFHYNLCEYNADKIARWPRYVKEAVLLWYEACRAKLVKDNEEVFNGGDTTAKNYFDGLFGVMRSIAKEGTYGRYDDIENMYVAQAMLEMRKTVEEVKEIQRKAKENEPR